MNNPNWYYRLSLALFFILVLITSEMAVQFYFIGGLAVGPIETLKPLLTVALWFGYALTEPVMIICEKPWWLFAALGRNLGLDTLFFVLPWITATIYTTILHLIFIQLRKRKEIK